VGDGDSSVAVCTLADTELPERIHSERSQDIAIVGYCETENIGIEKVIKNIISNPHIRYLILCGDESGSNMMGHFSGQAILSLHANGLSDKGKIFGARGKRPVLKNVILEEVKRFQSQVEIVDRIGTSSIEEIGGTIQTCLSKNASRFQESALEVRSNSMITARNSGRLVLDKNGFFVILPQIEENEIYVEYYANSGELLHTIVGEDAVSIYSMIIEKGFVSRLDHSAYLGKELTRAEYYLKYGIPYVQDRTLGESENE